GVASETSNCSQRRTMAEHALTIMGLRIVARSASGGERTLVDGVDLTVQRGEILGLIGESGAGKSTIGLAATAYPRHGCPAVRGQLMFDGWDLGLTTSTERRNLRGRRIAYVAQSAAASFNPAKTLFAQICEPLVYHGLMDEPRARERAVELFRELDLPAPESF